MKMTLSPKRLVAYVARQLSTTFPDRDVVPDELERFSNHALERLEYCFRNVRKKYFFDGVEATFDHLNTDQYAMYLYFLGNSIHRMQGEPSLGVKLFALNKALHALDVFYQVELPDIFAWQHPVGTVLGRARYADYAFFYQRCTVGGNPSHDYPVFEQGVVLYGDSAVIGRSLVRRNSWVSVGTKILDQDTEGDVAVFGRSPDLVAKRTKRNVVETFFGTTAQ